MEGNIFNKPHTIQQQINEEDTTQHKQIISLSHKQPYNYKCNDIVNLQQYVQNFQKTIEKVNKNQLSQLKNKYRYYLTKSQKLQQTKYLLQSKYHSIHQIVQNSLPVVQQNKRLQFITIMTQVTNNKLNQLINTINTIKQQKHIYEQEIANLKNTLKKQKNNFFFYHKILTNIKSIVQSQKKQLQLSHASSIFKNIINEKVSKKKLKISHNINYLLQNHSNFSQIKYEHNQNAFPQISNQGKKSINNRMHSYFRNTSQSEDTRLQAKSQQKLGKTSALFQTSKLNLTQLINSKNKMNHNELETKTQLLSVNQSQSTLKLKKNFIKQQTPSKPSNWKLQKQHSQLKAPKNKASCSKNQKMVQKYKLSLDNEQLLKIKQKVGKISHNKKQQPLLKSTTNNQSNADDKDIFMKFTPDQIIKLIISKNKICEFLQLFSMANVYSFYQQPPNQSPL